MKVTQEKLPSSQLGLEIEIPAQESKKIYEKVIRNLSRSVRIPGFRQGKVPRHILLQRIGMARIKAEALEQLIQDHLDKAIEQEEIKALGNYQLKSSIDELISQYTPGDPLTFSASVDIPPEVELGEYQNLTVKAEEINYDPAKVDEFLKGQQEEQFTLIPVEGRGAKLGDVTVVDYSGRRVPEAEGEEGELINGAQATDFQLELAEGKFIQDLLEGIEGMNPEETKEIPVTFPEDYPREDLAAAKAIFTVTLKEIKEKELPELDDDFAEEVSEFETMDTWRESLEAKYREEAEDRTKANIQEALTVELLTKVTVEFPETLIDKEVESMLTQTAMQMSQYGMDINTLFNKDTIPQMKERSRPEAINRLTRTYALLEIAQQENLTVEPEALETKIQELMEELQDQEVDSERVKEVVEDDLKREKALDWLQEQGSVELVPEGSLEPQEEEETESEASDAESVTEPSDAETVTIDVDAQDASE